MKWILIFLMALSFQKAHSMKPYRPAVLKFHNSAKTHELHLPLDAPGKMIKAKGQEVIISQLPERLNPKLVLTNPTDGSLIFLGGLGDAGVDLGSIQFIGLNGKIRQLNLQKSIPNLEKLVNEYRETTNFPWISAVHLTDKSLALWICKKVEAQISLSDLTVKIENPKSKPSWVSSETPDNTEDIFFTMETKKHLWERIRE